jgi:acyl-CoA dehydrogenase
MISFELTDEQKQLRDMTHKFAANEIRPKAAEYDRAETFPQDIMEKAFELGLMTDFIPEEYGGMGLGALEASIISEEISWGCSGIYTSMEASALALMPILIAGTNEQLKRFVAPFSEKLMYSSFCLTEPGAGSDAGAVKTTAKKDGNNFILNGRKCLSSGGLNG